jgi:hypothetical protein
MKSSGTFVSDNGCVISSSAMGSSTATAQALIATTAEMAKIPEANH